MTSIFIPCIDANITIDQIKNILENVFKLGTILRIECQSNRQHKSAFYCYVFFLEWNDNEYAKFILSRLEKNEPTRIFHNNELNDWIILKNLCEMSFYRDPIHMDLILQLHSDIRCDTILSLIEFLDIGEVQSIEIDNNIDNVLFPFKTNTIHIHFKYWYRTKSAYDFQTKIIKDNYIEIYLQQTKNCTNEKRINNHFWTFYPENPRYSGMNPNIWTNTLQTESTIIVTNRVENIISDTVENLKNVMSEMMDSMRVILNNVDKSNTHTYNTMELIKDISFPTADKMKDVSRNAMDSITNTVFEWIQAPDQEPDQEPDQAPDQETNQAPDQETDQAPDQETDQETDQEPDQKWKDDNII